MCSSSVLGNFTGPLLEYSNFVSALEGFVLDSIASYDSEKVMKQWHGRQIYIFWIKEKLSLYILDIYLN